MSGRLLEAQEAAGIGRGHPPDVRHYADVVGDEPVLNLDIFIPSRPDYA